MGVIEKKSTPDASAAEKGSGSGGAWPFSVSASNSRRVLTGGGLAAEALDPRLIRLPSNQAREGSTSWIWSGTFHALVVGGVLVLALLKPKERVKVEISVIEKIPEIKKVIKPTTLSRPVPPKPKAPPPKAVFGLSKKSIVADAAAPGAVEVKVGNTVAKAPDTIKMDPKDADALPIPADEFLVTVMPKLVSEVRVPYPAAAKQAGLSGAVVMDLLIDENGKVREALLVEGPGGGLNEAALEGIKQFQFSPAEIEGKKVAVRIRYAYRFVLER
jgi:TonB family protein